MSSTRLVQLGLNGNFNTRCIYQPRSRAEWLATSNTLMVGHLSVSRVLLLLLLLSTVQAAINHQWTSIINDNNPLSDINWSVTQIHF